MTYIPFDQLHAYHDGVNFKNFPVTGTGYTIDPEQGLPAPCPAYDMATYTYTTVINVSPPLSMRVYIKHPGTNGHKIQLARFLGCTVLTSVRGDGGIGHDIDVNGKGVVASLDVTPGAWVRFEFNATSTTSVRARAWQVAANATETVLLDYSTTTMTARAGGNIGSANASLLPATGTVRYDNLAVVPTAADIGPADHLPPRVTACEGGARTGVKTGGVVTGGAVTGLKLAGIYEARGGDKVYYDVTAMLAAIDAATTVAEATIPLSPLLTQSKVTLVVYEADGAYRETSITAVTVDNPRFKPLLKYLARSLAQLPPSGIARGAQSTIRIGRTLVHNGSPVSGVAYTDLNALLAVEPTQIHYDTIGTTDDLTHPGLVMHELAHILEYSAGSGSTALADMDAEIHAANPPGFTYLGADAATAPYAGDHPEGFVRSYSRANRQEDYADVFMALTVPAMYPDLRAWVQGDPYLRAKVAAVKKFVEARTWAYHVLEEMHGSLPHVRPL